MTPPSRLRTWGIVGRARAEYDEAGACATSRVAGEAGERRWAALPPAYFERLELRFDPPLRGMRAPACLASLSAMATACLRFRTFAPEEERSDPCWYSRITFSTLPFPLPVELLVERRAIGCPPARLPRALSRVEGRDLEPVGR